MANMLLVSSGLMGISYFSYKKFSTNSVAYADSDWNEFEIEFASSL